MSGLVRRQKAARHAGPPPRGIDGEEAVEAAYKEFEAHARSCRDCGAGRACARGWELRRAYFVAWCAWKGVGGRWPDGATWQLVGVPVQTGRGLVCRRET